MIILKPPNFYWVFLSSIKTPSSLFTWNKLECHCCSLRLPCPLTHLNLKPIFFNLTRPFLPSLPPSPSISLRGGGDNFAMSYMFSCFRAMVLFSNSEVTLQTSGSRPPIIHTVNMSLCDAPKHHAALASANLGAECQPGHLFILI